MAIEIKELIIKVNVQTNSSIQKAVKGELTQDEKNQLVKDCVEKVLEKLESKTER